MNMVNVEHVHNIQPDNMPLPWFCLVHTVDGFDTEDESKWYFNVYLLSTTLLCESVRVTSQKIYKGVKMYCN